MKPQDGPAADTKGADHDRNSYQSSSTRRIEARLGDEQQESRIAALHQQRTALRERIEEEAARVDALHANASNWRHAQAIRAYVAAIEAHAMQPLLGDTLADWCHWARAQADRLDPLTPSPPSILDTPKDDYRKLSDCEYLEENGTIIRM